MNKVSSILLIGVAGLVLTGPAFASQPKHQAIDHSMADKTQIIAVLTKQQAAWNDCDIDGFMSGYWHSPKLRFSSGGNITRGWQATLDNYKVRYDGCGQMGQLDFSNLDVEVFSSDAAQVFGHWGLVRAKDHPHGLFTLTFRKIDGAWKVIADHTSSASND